MTDSDVTLLPEPLSPTMATVSPGMTSKETLRTTLAHCPSTRKDVVRPRTERTGAPTGDEISRAFSARTWAPFMALPLVAPHGGAHSIFSGVANDAELRPSAMRAFSTAMIVASISLRSTMPLGLSRVAMVSAT